MTYARCREAPDVKPVLTRLEHVVHEVERRVKLLVNVRL